MNIEKLSHKKISSLIHRDLESANIQFITILITPWHAIGFEAWYLENYKKWGDNAFGYIFIAPHRRDGILLDEKNFLESSKNERNKFLILNNLNGAKLFKLTLIAYIRFLIWGIIHRLSSNHKLRNIIIITPKEPYYTLLPRFFKILNLKELNTKYIIFDEGLASYLPEKHFQMIGRIERNVKLKCLVNKKSKNGFKLLEELKNISKKQSSINFFLRFKRLLDLSRSKFYNKMFSNTSSSYFLFSLNQNGILEINKSIAIHYKTAIKRIIDSFEGDLINKNNSIKNAILITQPLFQYEILIKKIISELIQRGFEQIIIKPHPREIRDHYLALKGEYNDNKLKILTNNWPIEIVFPSLNPKYYTIIGYASTALLTAKALYGLESYSLANYISDLIISNKSKISILLEKFFRLGKNYLKDYRDLS